MGADVANDAAPEGEVSQPKTTDWASMVAILAILAGCALCVYLLSGDARREIDRLATASSDSTQWTLAQAEVELANLRIALVDAAQYEDGTDKEKLRAVRRRFDIFYSRVTTISESPTYARLTSPDDSQRSLAEIRDYLDGAVPHIDGSDPELAQSLAALQQGANDISRSVRTLTLSALTVFSEQSVDQRARVSLALVRLAVLAVLLVIGLFFVMVALAWLFALARQQAKRQARTTARLETVIETSPNAVIVADRKANRIELNRAAVKLLGVPSKIVAGKRLDEFVRPTKAAVANSLFAKPRSRGTRMQAVRPDGKRVPVEIAYSETRAGGTEIQVAYLRDLTRQIAQESHLDATARRERSSASYLRRLARAVVERASHNADPNADGQDALAAMGLLEALADGVAWREQEADLAELICTAVADRRAGAVRNGNIIACDLPPGPPPHARIDWALASAAITRLVVAAEAPSRNARITIGLFTSESPHSVEITAETTSALWRPDMMAALLSRTAEPPDLPDLSPEILDLLILREIARGALAPFSVEFIGQNRLSLRLMLEPADAATQSETADGLSQPAI